MNEFDYSLTPGRIRLDREVKADGEPLLSIITPFYNAGQFFRETVNSVLNQTFPYFEWIIVNDGSTNEEDVKLLQEIEKLDNRISVHHKENGGLSSARNFGVRLAVTDIVIPLDADDLIEPTYCECVYWSLTTNPEASWSYTDCVGFFDQEYVWKKPFVTKQMKTDNFLTCTAGIRKKDLLEAGLYTELEGHFNEDWHLWLKLLKLGNYPVHMGWYGFWYRRRNQGMNEHVKRNAALKHRSDKLIKQEASKISDRVRAIEFPRYEPERPFPKPEKWDWNRPPILSDDKIKVLMLLPHMEMGGADVFNLDIVSRINKDEFEMSIITTNPGNSTWRQKFERHLTDLFDLTTFLNVDQWASFVHYFIKSRGIHILFISNSYFGYYLAPWLRKEFPDLIIIDYVHMEEWYWRAGGYARTSGAISDIIEKTYVCNKQLERVMVDSFGKKTDEIETLYIGVDQEEFDPDTIEAGIARQQFGLAMDRPIVLFPCRIHPQKRPFLMVKIAKVLRIKVPNVAFVVVGDGPQLAELQEVVKKEGLNDTVYFAGRQNDVRSYYKDSAVTLICSLKEGLSLTAYESLAMGVPVVTSDVGGQKELVNEWVGKVIPMDQDEKSDLDNRNFLAEEINKYVDAIYELLSLSYGEQQKLKQACRYRIEQGFTKKHMIERIENEFRSWKQGRGTERRKRVYEAIQLFPRLIDDYCALYTEFEIYTLHTNRSVQFVEYFKQIIKLEKSPIAVAKDFKRLSNRYFIQRYLAHIKALRVIRLFSFIKKLKS